MSDTIKELKRLQSLGMIRHYGVLNFGSISMNEAYQGGGGVVTNQVCLWR